MGISLKIRLPLIDTSFLRPLIVGEQLALQYEFPPMLHRDEMSVKLC